MKQSIQNNYYNGAKDFIKWLLKNDKYAACIIDTDEECIRSEAGFIEDIWEESLDELFNEFKKANSKQYFRRTNMENLMKEVGKLQDNYQKLVDGNKLTKKAMCDLVITFRDKYKLTDLQALMVARNELSISEIADLLSD